MDKRFPTNSKEKKKREKIIDSKITKFKPFLTLNKLENAIY